MLVLKLWGVVLGLFLRFLIKKENRNFLKIKLMKLNAKDILKSCIRKQKNTPLAIANTNLFHTKSVK